MAAPRARVDPPWVSAEEWDAIVAASPAATGFHARAWMEAMASSERRFRPRALGWTLPTGERVVLPLLVRSGALRRGPLGRGVSSYPNVYGGPLCAERLLGERDWPAVIDALARAPLGRVECHGSLLQPLPAALPGRLLERETHAIELAQLPPAAVDSYRSSCRRAVRKAERAGVSVARSCCSADVAEYFEVYRESLARWGKAEGEGYALALFEALVQTNAAELWLARARDGRIAAGGLFVFARAHVVYWQGAMREELAEDRPANALHDALIEEARRRGASLYDFNPSAGLGGVRDFKESFNARAVSFRVWRYERPWLGFLGSRRVTGPRP